MKKIFLLVSGLLILLSVPLTIFLINQNTELRSRAAPATTLSFDPTSATVNEGETVQLNVQIDTGQNQVVAVELHISYDEEKLEAQTITNGPLFPNILASGVIDSGLASITVGATSAVQPVSGVGAVATIRFTPIAGATGTSTVQFTTDTFVGSPGEGATNALVGSTPATITISGGQPTNTPTSTPSPTPPDSGETGTGTPTPTPTDTTGETGTGTPTPTPTDTDTTGGTSVITISSPSNQSTITETLPDITGVTTGDATVTLTIYSDSDPITSVVTADSVGNWSYSPETELAVGSYTVVASTTDAETGETYNTTSTFTLGTSDTTSTEAEEEESTDDIPVTGTVETTYILLGLGLLLLIGGAAVPLLLR